ncbi:hypothetical protein GBA52_027731 [Prunus armeniaca]|nr:hypothetical protein GBA52_027731 [Prunus armeniaca]
MGTQMIERNFLVLQYIFLSNRFPTWNRESRRRYFLNRHRNTALKHRRLRLTGMNSCITSRICWESTSDSDGHNGL